jgi:hypothetical protein
MERMKDIKQIIAFLLCIAYPKSGNGEGQLRCHHEQFGTDHEPVEVGRSKQAWLYQPQMFCAAVCSLALAQLPEYIKSHVTMTFISVVQFCNQLGSHKLLKKNKWQRLWSSQGMDVHDKNQNELTVLLECQRSSYFRWSILTYLELVVAKSVNITLKWYRLILLQPWSLPKTPNKKKHLPC